MHTRNVITRDALDLKSFAAAHFARAFASPTAWHYTSMENFRAIVDSRELKLSVVDCGKLPCVWFTLNQSYEPSIKPPSGGWVRFGRPAASLHSIAHIVKELDSYRRVGVVEEDALALWKRTIEDWRVSYKPVAVLSTVIEFADDSLVWKRIHTPGTAQTTSPLHLPL